jgi:hypothetical protein
VGERRFLRGRDLDEEAYVIAAQGACDLGEFGGCRFRDREMVK